MNGNGTNSILILNGGHSEIPLIEAAKRLGFKTITTGNAPELVGHEHADEYHNADFSNKEEILELAECLGVGSICSSANDFGAITASYVAEKLSLGGHDPYETCLTVHHKDRFKKHAETIDLPTPSARSFDKREDALASKSRFNLPLMVKPIDLTGGKGISRVQYWAEFKPAVENAISRSPSGKIVIEEFFEGSQHSFSTFIVDHKVVFAFSDDELSYLNPYLVSTSAAPAQNIDEFGPKLTECAERFAKSLGLVDGILHFQYLANGDRFTIIEITRRCSGDLYPLPVNVATGIDWAEWIVRAESGMDCQSFPKIEQRGYCGRHCIMGNTNGTIEAISIADELKKNIHSSLIWSKPGDRITDFRTYKAGVLTLRYDSRDEMFDVTNRLNELVEIKLRPKSA